MIVSSVPGTTRDAVDTFLQWEEVPIALIDTAGIRRPGKVAHGVEYYSVLRALRAIQRADVVLLMIDGYQGVRAQDTHIAGAILDEWASVVVVINKWDLVEKDSDTMEEYTQWVREALKLLMIEWRKDQLRSSLERYLQDEAALSEAAGMAEASMELAEEALEGAGSADSAW